MWELEIYVKWLAKHWAVNTKCLICHGSVVSEDVPFHKKKGEVGDWWQLSIRLCFEDLSPVISFWVVYFGEKQNLNCEYWDFYSCIVTVLYEWGRGHLGIWPVLSCIAPVNCCGKNLMCFSRGTLLSVEIFILFNSLLLKELKVNFSVTQFVFLYEIHYYNS